VEVFCAYDKPRNKVVYFPRHQPNLKLMEMDWMGPRHGPYRYLYYEKPPNHAVPIAPLMHLLTKHKSFNTLDMKTIHQAQVSKFNMFYTNASKAEAERIKDSFDNQTILQENGAVRGMHIGGASPDTVAMAEKQRRDFSYASGGVVDQFQQQGDTLGQERLLRGSVNEMMDDMSGWAYQFMKGFAEDVFWFDIRDPDPQAQMLRKSIAGTDLSYETAWTSEHRRFAMDMEFDVDVEPYSYVERSPQSRLADLLGALQIMQTFGEQAMAQGIMIDVEAVVRTIAKYKNLPELYDVLILNQDPEKLQQLLGPRSSGGQGAPDTGAPKRYIRESKSDGAGAEQEIMRMFGRGGQNSQVMVA
jgi:hypothetical protein